MLFETIDPATKIITTDPNGTKIVTFVVMNQDNQAFTKDSTIWVCHFNHHAKLTVWHRKYITKQALEIELVDRWCFDEPGDILQYTDTVSIIDTWFRNGGGGLSLADYLNCILEDQQAPAPNVSSQIRTTECPD